MSVADEVRFRELIGGEPQLERIATGFLFTEGPIWVDGGLLFSDMPGDKRRRWTPEGGVAVVRDPSNRCNGMTLEDDGALLVCEHNTSRVVRERPGAEPEVVASHYGGGELNSPNDVIVARDGSIVFTDPPYGRLSDAVGIERPLELSFCGVYRIPPGGGEPELLIDELEHPNGLCLSPDERVLYVNDTAAGTVHAYERGEDWRLSGARVVADVGNDVAVGAVDGMKLDEHGHVYVTGPGGVWILTPDGERIGLIEVPEVVGNLNWGDEDWRTLYIAASSSVYRLRMGVAGNRLGYMR